MGVDELAQVHEFTNTNIRRVARAYVEVFAAEPWLEEWTLNSALEQINRAREKSGQLTCIAR